MKIYTTEFAKYDDNFAEIARKSVWIVNLSVTLTSQYSVLWIFVQFKIQWIFGKFEDTKMDIIEIYKIFEVEYSIEETNLDIIFLEKLKNT